MTLVGAVFAAAFLGALLLRPAWLLIVLGLSIPFQNTAMLVLGANSLTVFWGGVVILSLRVAWLLLQPAPARLGTGYLRVVRIVFGAFVVYALAVTLISPRVFRGLPVYVPRYGIDDQVLAQGRLAPDISNLAQVIYLGLAVVLVCWLVLEREIRPQGVAVGLVVGLTAALLREAVGDAWPTDLLENMPNIWYSIYETRARGTFAEPSGLAAFLAAGFGYFGTVLLAPGRSTLRRWWAAAALGGVLATYALARAGTGLAGITGVLVVAALVWLVRSGRRTVRLPAWTRPAFGVGLVGLVAASPVLYLFTVGMVQQKTTTSSASSRSAADTHAFHVFLDTYGIGVGLGGNRPSSLLMLLLSNVGVVGTALLLTLVVVAAVGAYRGPATRPYTFALVAAVAAGFSSKPDLSEPMLWVLVGLGVRAGADAELRRTTTGRSGSVRPGVPRRVGGRARSRG